jgi:hypothetical protein
VQAYKRKVGHTLQISQAHFMRYSLLDIIILTSKSGEQQVSESPFACVYCTLDDGRSRAACPSRTFSAFFNITW